MFETFYNETIRNTVIAFGSLFNEIYVVRKDSSGSETGRLKVPVTYAPKEKFKRMLDEYSRLVGTENEREIGSILPRIGFNIEAMNYDQERKRNTLSRRYSANPDSGKISYEYAEVPYNIDFFVTVATRSMEDGLQIIEQIMAYFTPEFTVTVNFNSNRSKIDVPITLSAVTSEIDFEGDLSTQRSIIFNLAFTARTYIYGPTKSSKIIKTVDTRWINSNFDLFGEPTGTTGALARQFSSVTGPSGIYSTEDNFLVQDILGSTTEREKSLFEYPDTLNSDGTTI